MEKAGILHSKHDRLLLFKRKSEVIFVYIFLVIFFIAAMLLSDRFMTERNLRNLIISNIGLLFVAYGQLFIVLLGGVDLSVGSVISLTNVICVTMITENPSTWFLAFIASLAAGAGVGLVNLPDISGWKVKESLGNTPVIYVTARDELGDKIRGLNGGAQDYIVKPFAMEELVARVHVVLRRFQKDEKLFRLHGTEVFLDSCQVKVDGETVALTYQEFELLRTLIIHKNIALSRDQLLDMAWGMDFLGDARTVDVHIQRIRKKLHLENDIKTVYKRGYRLEC